MKKNIQSFILSLMTSFAFFFNIRDFVSIENGGYNIFYNQPVFVVSIVALLFFWFYKKRDGAKLYKGKVFLAYLFSLFMVLGECYKTSGTYFVLFENVMTVIAAFIKLIGYVAFFKLLFSFLDLGIQKGKEKELQGKNKYVKKYISFFKKYPFRTSFITILLVWSIYLLAFYPIVLSPDPSYQILQYFNVHTKYIDWVIQRDPNVFMTAHHPVLQTFLLGWSISFGRFLGSDNFGLFVYTFLQTILYASVLSYTIKFALKNEVSTRFAFYLLLLYLFVPMFPFYTLSAVKDVPYTLFMILFVLGIYDLVRNYKDKKISLWYSFYFFIVMLLMSLFRHNGVYVILLTLPFVLLYTRKNILRLLFPFFGFLVCLYSFNSILVPSLGISDGSTREILSIPFQQTARLAKYRPEEFSEEDIEIVDKILGFETLGERYNPDLSDPVKNEYNKFTTKEDLLAYFKVWKKGLVSNLDLYVDATMNGIYGFFYPEHHNWYLYDKYYDIVTRKNTVDYHFNSLGFLRDFLSGYGNLFPYIPVIGLVANMGFHTWVVLILSVYLVWAGKKKYLIALIPLYCSILMCVVGPANTYFRYAMPYMFLLPVLICLLFKEVKKNEKK